MLQKRHRLKKNAEIQEVRRKGQSWRNRWLILSKLENGRSESRFAFAVSRRVGNAVVRNRVKRLFREALYHRLPFLPGGWDVLLIARPLAKGARFNEMNAAVADLLKRAHLLIENPTSIVTSEESADRFPP